MITLRAYQNEAIERVLEDWQAGYKSVLLVMATGCGKTAVFLTLLHQVLGPKKRALIIAHRKELIDQPVARLQSYYPEWIGKIGVVMGDQDNPAEQITVATIQSLAASPRRLERILLAGPIDYMVTDEAHHATDKNSYSKVLAALREANPEMLHLGVTATPLRADGDGLSGVFEKCSYKFGIVEGIQQGFLAPVRWLAIQTSISLADVRTAGGDFVQYQLADVFETDNCFDLVVETHRKYAGDRQAAAYTVSVEGAYKLAERFNAAGIPAAAADGTVSKTVRSGILRCFERGETKVLVNVGLWTEGLDIPQISCIHQVRPTKSDSLYTQIIGRALRIYPGKDDALILDYAPADVRNVAMMGDVLGVPLRRESYLREEELPGEAQGGFTFDGAFRYLEGNPAEIISRQLDYLNVSPWSWWRDEKNGWMSLGLGLAADHLERVLVISPPDDDGQLALYGLARRIEEDGKRGEWRGRELAHGSFAELSEQAEMSCIRYGNPSLAQKAREWRSQPPSDKQIAYARRLRGAWKPGLTKGQLAQSITHAQALKALREIGIGA